MLPFCLLTTFELVTYRNLRNHDRLYILNLTTNEFLFICVTSVAELSLAIL